jgi:hypothetical protein
MLSIQQLVVGIFRNRARTEQAINELRQVGFDNRHIRFAVHGISTGWMLEKIKRLFREQDISGNGRIYNDLVEMGMPQEDARYYQREFEAGYSIVAVLKSGVPLVATSILLRNGGHIVNEHFAQFMDYGRQDTSVQEPATEDVNAELNSTDESIAPSADDVQGTSAQEPATEGVNAELNSTDECVFPSTGFKNGNDIQDTDKYLINA